MYKAAIIILICLLGIGVFLWDMVREPSRQNIIVMDNNKVDSNLQEIPAFTAIDFNGNTFSTQDLKGQVGLINFWASWCAPCIVEFPDLIQLADKKDIVLVLISVDSDIKNARSFIDKMAKSYDDTFKRMVYADNIIYIHDPKKEISQDLFQTVLYPESYIFDRNSKIQRKVSGIIEWHSDDTIDYFETLLYSSAL